MKKIEELRDLYKKNLQIEISEDEARELGSHLIHLIELICFTSDETEE